MRSKVGAVVLGLVGLAVGVLAVGALREATLSTHERVPDDSSVEVVVRATARGAEPGQTLAEMVEAKLLMCRLEVTSDVVGEIEALPDDRFRAVLEPAMDQTNRRQFRGCLEDRQVDHLTVDVVSLASG